MACGRPWQSVYTLLTPRPGLGLGPTDAKRASPRLPAASASFFGNFNPGDSDPLLLTPSYHLRLPTNSRSLAEAHGERTLIFTFFGDAMIFASFS